MDTTVRPSYKASLSERLLVGIFHLVNKVISWHKLPGFIGALNLEALRIELRQYNLHDGYASGTAQGSQTTDPLTDKRFEHARHSEGKFNSVEMPRMGCAGMRLGRNFPRSLTPKPTEDELWSPNPRMLSERFMARKTFIPATTLNLLAAAWIQFQTHDWFNHESVRWICPGFMLIDGPRLLMLYRVMRLLTFPFPRVIIGHTARWSSHVRSPMRSYTQPTSSLQDTRTPIPPGGTVLKSMDLVKL